MRAYKLLRMRRDLTLGPLFINCRQVIPIGQWLQAECHPTKGYAVRPGWHCTARMSAPHLSKHGRAWCECEVEDAVPHVRPRSQGGVWYIAQRMRITRVIKKFPPKTKVA